MTNPGEESDSFDLASFLPFLLNQAAEEASLAFQNVYKGRYGMLRTEWRVLSHLGMYGRMTAKDIGDRARVHKTKISRAVRRLEERRFLTRSPDEADRRSEILQLTPAGEAAYRDLSGVARDYDAQLAARFSPEDQALLRRMLRQLADRG
ncbi:MarR family winged helix-turn-helix transcriptional regulator [Pseudodonghicola flavimaris]|uniref:MarR family transcriptional regulator n=1 Tax=Pseudodonghicola flavimaris TaxID=3050036 RepID=A0ABT7F6Z8_9RHOB|nr:MarR family transcriptional regulator [Pseudodonghicola flavimaris]MDK3020285.1 MarR family transcriptional regulator [Pseudodonghicola flavimaris]